MKSVIKTLQQILMKKKTIMNLKKVLEWGKLREVILKKKNLIEEGKTEGIDKIVRQNA